MTESVDLPDETKETLMAIMKHAASKDRTVVEFTVDEGALNAKEITEHIEVLENE